MKTHELKTWPEFFEALITGQKNFEVRKNDRDFHPGDYLQLREWDAEADRYTGRELRVFVTYMMVGPAFGLKDGFVVMAVRR